jgi:hypothetical protein
MRYIWSILLILNGMPYRWCRISNPLVQAEDPHGGMAGYDPSLYASTGSWAGLPYDTPAYGGPPPQGGYGGYAPQSYAPGPPQSYGPPEGFAPMPARGMYGSFRETGPPQQVSMQYVDGPPGPPGGMYRSGYAPRPSYGMPMYEPQMYGGPPPQPRQKVYGVRLPSPILLRMLTYCWPQPACARRRCFSRHPLPLRLLIPFEPVLHTSMAAHLVWKPLTQCTVLR